MIGIISEGTSDQAIITNILSGVCKIDSSEITYIRPVDNVDETDINGNGNLTLGGWSRVKMECESKELIDQFLTIEGNEYIILHIDTAECQDYGIDRPVKNKEYCKNLRKLVIDEIKTWLGDYPNDFAIYAVAIEEIDAWLLTIYDKKDSSTSAKPKEKLENKIKGKAPTNFDEGFQISKAFRKSRNFIRENYRDFNCSLDLFCSEIEEKICG